MSAIQQALLWYWATSKVYATWNPSDKWTNITLSNSNTTAVNTTAGWQIVRSTVWKSSWKWYWEVTANSATSMIVGIANSSGNLLSYLGSDANSWWWSEVWTKYYNSVWTAYWSTYTTGVVIWVALDMDIWTLTYYLNNVSQGTAFTGITWTIFASVGSIISSQTTTNFWASAFTYSPPWGFNSWLYN